MKWLFNYFISIRTVHIIKIHWFYVVLFWTFKDALHCIHSMLDGGKLLSPILLSILFLSFCLLGMRGMKVQDVIASSEAPKWQSSLSSSWFETKVAAMIDNLHLRYSSFHFP